MRFAAAAVLAALFVSSAIAQNLPRCNSQLLTRQGNHISMSAHALSNVLNRRLAAAGSEYHNLLLVPQANNRLRVAAIKNGDTVSIVGPVQTTDHGEVQIHAEKILKNGAPMKGFMDLFGQDLGDRMHPKDPSILNVQGNDLIIHPDPLLGLRGQATGVQLVGSRIEMQFASPPCR